MAIPLGERTNTTHNLRCPCEERTISTIRFSLWTVGAVATRAAPVPFWNGFLSSLLAFGAVNELANRGRPIAEGRTWNHLICGGLIAAVGGGLSALADDSENDKIRLLGGLLTLGTIWLAIKVAYSNDVFAAHTGLPRLDEEPLVQVDGV